MPGKSRAKGRKVGRERKKPSHQRYVLEDRAAKHKRTQVAKRARRLARAKLVRTEHIRVILHAKS